MDIILVLAALKIALWVYERFYFGLGRRDFALRGDFRDDASG